MASVELARLRPVSAYQVVERGEARVALVDPFGVCPRPQVLAPLEFRAARRFDGSATAPEIRAALLREAGAAPSEVEILALAKRLERALLLEGPTFEAFLARDRSEPTRPPALAGRSYPAEPQSLRDQLDGLFRSPKGSGMPHAVAGPRGSLRGVLVPHIDFGRGGHTYTWAYRALAERCDADLFVVLGVAHQPTRRRFALTRKDFDTPLGVVPTDRAFVDRLAELAGPHLFDDELAHRPEHSVEFQAVFLRHLLGGRRPFAIVPILAGSFHDLMLRGVEPIDDPEVRRFVDALRTAEAESGKRVAYVGSIDLCHVGPEFGDADPVSDRMLGRLRAFDGAMLDRAAGMDPAGWIAEAAAVRNRWRVCGLSATYTMLHALGPAEGRLLQYDQAVDPARSCCVTFASVSFDAPA